MKEIERAWSKHPGWFESLPRRNQLELMALDVAEVSEHNAAVKKAKQQRAARQPQTPLMSR